MSDQLLSKLKQGTQTLHKRAEEQNLARFIIDHTITLEQYKELLLKNYKIYKSVESFLTLNSEVLPHYLREMVSTEKSDALCRDLISLEVPIDSLELTPISAPTDFPSLLGMMYVIEGSMLGGLVIQKHIKKCAALQHLPKQHFFGNTPKSATSRWKQYCALTNRVTFGNQEVQKCILAAQKVFIYFIDTFTTEFIANHSVKLR